MRISTRSPTGTAPQLRCRIGVSGSAAASARRFIRAPRRHPAGSSQATSRWFETLRLYRDRAWAGALVGVGEEPGDDRRPTALRARPPRGAPRPRARVVRVPVVGRVVVTMRDSGRRAGDPSPHEAGRAVQSEPGWRPAAPKRAMRKPWLGYEGGKVEALGPG